MYPEKLPVIEHLEELRHRALICVVAVFSTSFVAYFFFDAILAILLLPVKNSISTFYYTGPVDAFIARIQISLFVGFLIMLPLVLYHVWRFIAPGLLPKERRSFVPISAAGSLLFFSGCIFCYFIVLPIGIKFLMQVGGTELTPLIAIDKYLGFVLMLLLAFGITFLLPIVLYMLARFHIISVNMLEEKRGFVLIVIAVLSAILTPPDVFSQLLLGIPMYLLFEISVIMLKILKK